jgi:hypothetical protein
LHEAVIEEGQGRQFQTDQFHFNAKPIRGAGLFQKKLDVMQRYASCAAFIQKQKLP